MPEVTRSNVASSSRKLVAGGKSRSDATSSTRKPATDDNPLSEIIEAQTKVTLMIVKNDVAEFLKAIINDPYMIHLKQGGALPTSKSLVFYADDPGHMLELSRYVDVALREVTRPMTLSPDGEPKDPIPVQREHQAVEQAAPQAEQCVVATKNSPPKKTSADAVIENGLVKRTSAKTFAGTAVTTVLACTAGALAVWIVVEYGERDDIPLKHMLTNLLEINGTVAAANFALRAIDGLAGARATLFRRVCLLIYDILGVVVSTLIDLHGESCSPRSNSMPNSY